MKKLFKVLTVACLIRKSSFKEENLSLELLKNFNLNVFYGIAIRQFIENYINSKRWVQLTQIMLSNLILIKSARLNSQPS